MIFSLVFPSALRSPKMSAEMLTRSGKRKPQSQDNEARLIVIVVCIKGHGKRLNLNLRLKMKMKLKLKMMLLLRCCDGSGGNGGSGCTAPAAGDSSPDAALSLLCFMLIWIMKRCQRSKAQHQQAEQEQQQQHQLATATATCNYEPQSPLASLWHLAMCFSSARNVCRLELIYWLNACKNRWNVCQSFPWNEIDMDGLCRARMPNAMCGPQGWMPAAESGFAVLCSVNASLNSSHQKRNVIKSERQQLRAEGCKKYRLPSLSGMFCMQLENYLKQ